MSCSEKLHPSAFGDDFVWGTASSAYQYEGASDKYGKGPSIWDTFTHKWPGRIVDGSNGTTAVDFYQRYKEDVQIMKKMGFNAFRLSISWSRILPSGKISGGKNEEGIQFYHDLIDELLSNGITPFVTLFHWDLPQALESEYKGFLSTQIVGDFCDYANLCFWEYGGKVKNWITLNEPVSYCCGGYVDGGLAPGRGSASSTPLNSSSEPLLPSANSPAEAHDVLTGIHQPRFQATEPVGNGGSLGEGNPGTEPYTVAGNQLLAHPTAVKPYKDKFQVKNGITLNEPAPDCIGGYVDSTLAPGRGPEIFTGIRLPRCQATEPAGNGGSSENGNPGTEPYIVARNQLLAHAAAVKLYKDNFQDFQKGQIGIVLVSNWFLPWDADSKEDKVAVKRALDFMLGWFMEPLIRGAYPQSMKKYVDENRLASLEDPDCPYEVKGSYDFIGINYYTAQYVRTSTKSPGPKPSYKTDQKLETSYHNKKGVAIGEQSGADWLYIYPKGIGELLKWIAKTYGEGKNSGHDNCCVKDLVIYITENGVAEKDDFKKTIKDSLVYEDASGGDMRTNYHKDHLDQVLNNAMTDITKNYNNVKIKGYFAWSLVDNYEWAGGYKTRFGLMYVDYKDGHLARYPKESATWFANFLN